MHWCTMCTTDYESNVLLLLNSWNRKCFQTATTIQFNCSFFQSTYLFRYSTLKHHSNGSSNSIKFNFSIVFYRFFFLHTVHFEHRRVPCPKHRWAGKIPLKRSPIQWKSIVAYGPSTTIWMSHHASMWSHRKQLAYGHLRRLSTIRRCAK